MHESEEAITLEPATPPSAVIIWLHGLGADGYDFLPVVKQMGLVEKGCRVILPHAPSMPVTINGGMHMPAWYDIRDINLLAAEDEEGIRGSADRVQLLLDNLLQEGIAADRIILAGFSQGGAIALHTGLRYPQPLGGIIALSTYLPLVPSIASEIAQQSGQVPVFLAHGLFDDVIPFQAAEKTNSQLRELGLTTSFYHYDIRHGVSPEEIVDIGIWLQKQLFE